MDIFFTVAQKYFLFGIILYGVIQLFLFKPVYLYVLGHECVHVLATWLCLGKVTSFSVSSQGGSVSTSKSNLFISLSPYVVPIYSIIIIFAYYVINDVFLWGFLAYKYFMLLLGLTVAFHVVLTVDTLKTRQPDFIRLGYLTSSVFIYVLNVTLISGVLGILFSSFSFTSFIKNAYYTSIDLYRLIYAQLFL